MCARTVRVQGVADSPKYTLSSVEVIQKPRDLAKLQPPTSPLLTLLTRSPSLTFFQDVIVFVSLPFGLSVIMAQAF